MSKREKHVFSTSEIPHLWAHKTQGDARNPQGNLYFNGDVIYSYGSHFPIASWIKNKQGKDAVLFTTRKYSSTTAGHISAVRSAIPAGIPMFHVSHPTNAVQGDVIEYLDNINSQIESANARKTETTRNEDVSRASNLIAECRAFCKFFSIKIPKFPVLPKIDAEKLARQSQAIKDRRDARDAARRAEWEAREAAHKAEADAWNASGYCTHTPKHDANKWGEKQTCINDTEDAEWLAKSSEIIERWRNGDANARLRNPYNLPVMLRVKAETVETSKGAQVPIPDAIRGLRFVRAIVAKGEEYVRNGHTFHMGHYAIDKIEKDGTLHAGCHVIPYSEIERIAPQLEAMETKV